MVYNFELNVNDTTQLTLNPRRVENPAPIVITGCTAKAIFTPHGKCGGTEIVYQSPSIVLSVDDTRVKLKLQPADKLVFIEKQYLYTIVVTWPDGFVQTWLRGLAKVVQ